MGEVPVITGNESSFTCIKKSDLDFISVENKVQLLEVLQRLKENRLLREEMVENGKARSLEFTEESIVAAWEKFLFNDAQLYYEKWIRKSNFEKQLFYTDLFLSRSVRSVKNRIKTRLQNN